MIVKGTAVKSASHASHLANHLLNANDNEICEVWEIDGHAKPNNLRSALLDYYETIKLTKGGKTGLFMISLNPEPGETMTDEQYFQAIEKAEKNFNLEGQPKAIVRHFKEKRNHIHVVWQTTDVEQKKNKAKLYYYQKECVKLARELEQQLQHKPVSNEKSKSSYSDREREQSKKSKDDLGPARRKKAIQTAFSQSKDSLDFSKRLSFLGYSLATGKVGMCLVDKTGQVYNLEKELKGTLDQKGLVEYFKDHPNKIPNANTLVIERKKSESKKVAEPPLEYNKTEKKARYRLYDELLQDFASSANEITAKNVTKENPLDASQEKAEQLKQQFKSEQQRKEADEIIRIEDQKRQQRMRDLFRDNTLDIIVLPFLLCAKLLIGIVHFAGRILGL